MYMLIVYPVQKM